MHPNIEHILAQICQSTVSELDLLARYGFPDANVDASPAVHQLRNDRSSPETTSSVVAPSCSVDSVSAIPDAQSKTRPSTE